VAELKRSAKKMSTPAVLFGIYIGVGLVLMIVAVATPGKEKRTKGFTPFSAGDAVDAALMLFIALLWPIWILSLIAKKEPPTNL
jgi:hypothetical protein